MTRKAAAATFHVTAKTAAKWVRCFQASGTVGLLDHSSRPHRSPRRLSDSLSAHIVELRREHMPGYEIARRTGASPASVSRVLRRRVLAVGAISTRRTRPYTPRTNGKAERLIQTALREWAYAKHWENSEERDRHLQPWTDYYNHQRPHGSLNYKPPISRSDTSTTS